MTCKADNCAETKIHGRGLCPKHYRQFRKETHKVPCSVDGCEKPTRARGLCVKHLHRFYSNGSVDVVRCAANGAAIGFIRENVNYAGDACLEWPFAIGKNGYYGDAYLNGKKDKAHRIMCLLAHGPPPEGKPIAAHWCGNAKCVSPKHLRWATYQENSDDNRRLGVKMGRKPKGIT